MAVCGDGCGFGGGFHCFVVRVVVLEVVVAVCGDGCGFGGGFHCLW